MIRSTAILTLFSITFNEGLYLEKEEISIAIDMIEALRIRHAILIDEDKYEEINLYNFKEFFRKVPTASKTELELEDHIESFKFINVKTLIIFKATDFSAFNLFILTVKLTKSFFVMSAFTWLIFTPESTFLSSEFLAPYDCEFIVAYPKSNIYELQELYNLGDNVTTSHYGTWDFENGLQIIRKPVYYRRTDMNKTFILGAAEFDFEECLTPRMRKYRPCNYLKILRDITSNLNFNYRTRIISEEEANNTLVQFFIMQVLEVNETWINLNQINRTFSSALHYFPKVKLKWFIKFPNETHLLNYFARPFSGDLWTAIHFTVIIGGLLTAIIQYSHSQVKKISHEFNFGNSMFAACDAFLNQGSEISDKASFRMAFIIFRFTALFIFPAYTADLTALLSIRKPEIDFQNLDEFSKNGKYEMLLPPSDNYIHVYFKDKSGDVGKQILNKSSIIYSDFEVAINMLCGNGKYALPIYSHPNVFGTSCKVYQMKNHLANNHHFGFLLGMDGFSSPYVRILNHKLLNLLEGGVIQKIEVLDSVYESSESLENSFAPVEFDQIRLILYIGFATVCNSCIILTLEVLAKHFLEFIKWTSLKIKEKKCSDLEMFRYQ